MGFVFAFRSIHGAASGIISFFWDAEYYSIRYINTWMFHIFFGKDGASASAIHVQKRWT